MLCSTKGIVIRNIKYGETSLITKVYTEAFGLRSYMINGVRKVRSKAKASLLQPLNILDLVVYERPNKNLQRVKEYKSGHIFTSIPFDVRKSAIGLFVSEIMYKTIREEEPNPDLFEYLHDFIFNLDAIEEGLGRMHLHFLIDLSRYLGFYPRTNFSLKTRVFDLQEGLYVNSNKLEYTMVHPPYSRLLAELVDGNEDIILDKSDRRELLSILLRYYQLHIENFSKIQSVEILQEVLA